MTACSRKTHPVGLDQDIVIHKVSSTLIVLDLFVALSRVQLRSCATRAQRLEEIMWTFGFPVRHDEPAVFEFIGRHHSMLSLP